MTSEICRFLAQACQDGASFDRVLTLGQQHVSVSPERLRGILGDHDFWPPKCGEAEFQAQMAEPRKRFEGFAKALGASSVQACDASDYEGAAFTHDLNTPVPTKWHRAFDAVIDSGTLEHVFNFPVALANCMRMVASGGRLFLFTPANNYFGHGFYQFSPELFYRTLVPANGFQVERMWARANWEATSRLFGAEYPFPVTSPAYAVADPAEIRQRVTLINSLPILLFVQARRISDADTFRAWPQQSDYVTLWSEGAQHGAANQRPAAGGAIGWLRRHLPETVWRELIPCLAAIVDPFRWWRSRRRHSFHNRNLYRRVKG